MNLSYVSRSYISYYFQNVCSYSATMNGVLRLPMGIIGLFAGVTIGTLASKTRQYKKLLIIQLVMVLASNVMIIFCTPQTVALFVVATCIQGFGMGASLLCPVTMVMNNMEERYRGTSVGMITFSVTLGSSLGNAVGGRILSHVWQTSGSLIPENVRSALTVEQLDYISQQSLLLDMNYIGEIKASLPGTLQQSFAEMVENLRDLLMSGIRYINVFCVICVALSIFFAMILKKDEVK